MIAWAPLLIVLTAMFLGCVLSALYIALGITSRGAVEECLPETPDGAASRARVEVIFDRATAHASAVGLFRLVCELAVVGGLIFWVAQVDPAGETIPPVADVLLGAGIALVVLWVFSVSIPMSIAHHAGAKLIAQNCVALRALERVASPLLAAGRFLDEMVRRLVGAERHTPADRLQADLLSVVEEGESLGALDEKVREMIEAIMKFPSRTVEEIMTPRTDVQALEYTNNLGTLIQTIKKIGHSRIPVFEENLDNIVGIFYVKDLMKWLAGEGTHGGGKPFDLKSILRPPVVVPWSKTVRELLDEMIQKKVHIALVADEYGGTAGLVTIEDIFEEIVGDIKDEYEPGPPETPSVQLHEQEQRAEIDAAARIDEVNPVLGTLGVEVPESPEYDTVGGFITTTLGRIPVKGERFTHERMVFVILEARPTRVVRVGVEVQPEEPPAGADEHLTHSAQPSGPSPE
ncbi:MAG: hemolysin family protein [Phycisphaerales bacterium]